MNEGLGFIQQGLGCARRLSLHALKKTDSGRVVSTPKRGDSLLEAAAGRVLLPRHCLECNQQHENGLENQQACRTTFHGLSMTGERVAAHQSDESGRHARPSRSGEGRWASESRSFGQFVCPSQSERACHWQKPPVRAPLFEGSSRPGKQGEEECSLYLHGQCFHPNLLLESGLFGSGSRLDNTLALDD